MLAASCLAETPTRGELLATVYRRPLAGRPAVVRVAAGSSLAEIAETACADPILRRYLVAHVDGEEVAAAAWGDMRPAEGQTVVLALRPGDSKTLRTVLTIAVVLTATVISGGAWTPAALEWAAPYLAGAFAVAANLAINALLAPEPQNSASVPAFHTLTGARNAAKPFEPVPMLFGRHRHVPPVWGRYVQETVGDDIWMRGVFCLGPAPCAVSDIRIGDTPIASFPDCELEMRLTADAPPHTLYMGDPDVEVLGTKLDTDWVESETGDDVDEIELVYGLREGLGAVDPDDGSKDPISSAVRIQYRLADTDDDWIELHPNAVQANGAAADAGEPNRGIFLFGRPISDWVGQLPTQPTTPHSGAFTYTRAEPGRAFQKVERFAVPRGKYAVRTRRDAAESELDYISDGVWWEFLNSRRTYVDAFPEPGVASIAFRIKATDQLSGVVDTFNVLQDSIVPVFSEAALASDEAIDAASPDSLTTPAASRNPAELTLNLYRGPQAMRPRPDARIDWPAWAGFAKFCADNGLHFDEIVDGKMSRGEMARRICSAGYGRPIRWAGKLSVVWDRDRGEDPPEQIFTPRNIANLRWQKTFAPEVHALRVAFNNADNGYQADEVILYAEGFAAEAGEGVEAATIFEQFSVPGKTDPDEVREFARQLWNNSEFQTERFTFDIDAEYVTVRPGAYAELQHDIMGTGLGSARVAALVMAGDDVAGFTLDAPIETQDGDTFGARWRKLIDDDGEGKFNVTTEQAVFRDPDDPRTFSFAAPVAPEDAPTPKGDGYEGDAVMIGTTEQVSLAVLVREILPEAGYRAAITAIPYAPERFTPDGDPLPPHDPKVTLPFAARPATPVLISTNADARAITLAFQQPASPRSVTLVGFECAWRRHGAADDAWEPLGQLNADERLLVAPPGDPAVTYDLFIQAVGRDSGGLAVRSDPLVVEEVEAEAAPVAPSDCTATFVTRTSASGASQVVLVATWAAVGDPDVLDTAIEIDTGSGVWAKVGGARAGLGKAEVHGLQVGRTYDIGFVNITRRGAVSARTVVEDVTAADTLVATAAQRAAPGSALEVDFGAAEDAAADALAAASAAASSATTAATQAGNAATSASAASGSAAAASSSASTASTQASNASTSASAAAGSATTASTQAGSAASSASAAAASATSAATQASNAATSATTASSQASSASSSASAAAASATQSATFSGRNAGSLMKNPVFNNYPTTPGLPPDWSNDSNATGGTRQTGTMGAYAFRLVGGAGADAGFVQGVVGRQGPYFVEVSAELISGAWTASGLILLAFGPGGLVNSTTYPLATTADTNGDVSNSKTGLRHWRFPAFNVGATVTSISVYVFSHNSTLGSTASANSIDWHQVDIRPSTNADAIAASASATASSASSAVATEAGARATDISSVRAEYRASTTSLVGNAAFQEPFSGTTNPPQWNNYSNGTGTQVSRVGSTGFAYRLARGAGTIAMNYQNLPVGSVKAGGKYILKVKLANQSGSLTGVGIELDWFNGASFLTYNLLTLSTTANTAGETSSTPSGVTTWEMEVTAPASANKVEIYMGSHPAFGSVAGACTQDWYEVDFYPVANADLQAAVANAAAVTNAGAIATINGAAAFIEAVVTASGGDLAAYRLRAGAGGSFIELISTVLRLANVSNGAVIEVMRAVSGEAYFSRPISSDGGGRRVTIGPAYGASGQEVLFWFGPDSTAPSSQSRTNGYFAIGSDGQTYAQGAVLQTMFLQASPANQQVQGVRSGAGSVTTAAASISAILGGSGERTYSYAWTYVSGDTFTINSPNASSTTATTSVTVGQTKTGIYRCTVTESGTNRTAFTDFRFRGIENT